MMALPSLQPAIMMQLWDLGGKHLAVVSVIPTPFHLSALFSASELDAVCVSPLQMRISISNETLDHRRGSFLKGYSTRFLCLLSSVGEQRQTRRGILMCKLAQPDWLQIAT